MAHVALGGGQQEGGPNSKREGVMIVPLGHLLEGGERSQTAVWGGGGTTVGWPGSAHQLLGKR